MKKQISTNHLNNMIEQELFHALEKMILDCDKEPNFTNQYVSSILATLCGSLLYEFLAPEEKPLQQLANHTAVFATNILEKLEQLDKPNLLN